MTHKGWRVVKPQHILYVSGFQSYDQGGGAGGQGGYMSPGGFGTPQQSQERKVSEISAQRSK